MFPASTPVDRPHAPVTHPATSCTTASSTSTLPTTTTTTTTTTPTASAAQLTSPGASESNAARTGNPGPSPSLHAGRLGRPSSQPRPPSSGDTDAHASSKGVLANGSTEHGAACALAGPSTSKAQPHQQTQLANQHPYHTFAPKPVRKLELGPLNIPAPAPPSFSASSGASVSSRPHPHISIDDSSYPLRSPTLFSPVSTPPLESGGSSGIHRRRSSNPPSPGSVFARPRRKTSIEQPRSATTSATTTTTTPTQRARTDEHGRSWFTNNLLTLPPAEAKHNKSDDERESEPQEPRRTIKAKKKRQWFGMGMVVEGPSAGTGMEPPPAISMTPPPASTAPLVDAPLHVPTPTNLSPPRPTTYTVPSPLAPLPQDPHNILPLSLPPSPIPSPPASIHPTPYHSPHPSIPDLNNAFTSGPSGSSGSPRTSISTSSSRAWQPSGSGGRSDSRSSAEDDDSPTFPSYTPHAWHHSRSWWFSAADAVPVSPKISTSSQARTLRPKFVPTGTRHWGWLLELIGAITPTEGQMLKSTARQRQRNRERERLMASTGGRTLRGQAWLGNKWLGRAMAFVPTNPWSIALSLTFVGFLIFLVTLTIKHILNPDKEPLPWRQYCTSDYPTLYALQDPNVIKYNFNAYPPDAIVASSSLNLVLAPVSPSSPVWPYDSRTRPPYPPSSDADADADAMAFGVDAIDTLEPVGVLVGVFTTDAGAQRRHMIRQSYASHWRSRTEGTEGVRVRFVMGRPRAKYARAVELEMEAFHDILLLDIPENMNSGKTHAFFSWAAENATVPHWEHGAAPGRGGAERETQPAVWRGERKPQYVVKADDDSFIMLGELERRLRAAPRDKAYWGYLVKNLFMAGECYALSFDLVQYIAESPAVKAVTKGKEDKLVSRWMRMHPEKERIVWVAERCWIYDHPKAGTVYSHGFLYPSTVAEVRAENRTGLSPAALELRGGAEAADSYSTVSKWGTAYRPLSSSMSAVEEIEALVEGSPLSRLRDAHLRLDPSGHVAPLSQAFSHVEPLSARIGALYASRPTRDQRFLGDKRERGGTVVVHYIKRAEWFVETMVAMLGAADEQSRGHRGAGTGLGVLEPTTRIVTEWTGAGDGADGADWNDGADADGADWDDGADWNDGTDWREGRAAHAHGQGGVKLGKGTGL